MKLIVGLGNPGREFDNTPHNAGFLAVDLIARELQQNGYMVSPWSIAKQEKAELSEVFDQVGRRLVVLAKPQTYMNLSGFAVQRIMQRYGIKEQQDVLVVYDELDISLGSYKYSPVKNSRTHKGIASIMSTIGQSVQSLRIGVDNRKNTPIPGDAYVLRRYSAEEQIVLSRGILEAIALHLKSFLGLL